MSMLRGACATAQAPAVVTDSAVRALYSAVSPGEISSSASCVGTVTKSVTTCAAIVAGRRAELTGSVSDAQQAETLLERLVQDDAKDPLAWYGLGRIRLQLARDSVLARGGAAMLPGTSYVTGAGSAFLEALRLDSSFAAAANALAFLPKIHDAGLTLKSRVSALRRARALLTPAALFAAATAERNAGHRDSAIAIERRVLASGEVDSGMVSLALAQDLYATGDPQDGYPILIKGAATATESAKAAYRRAIAWVAFPAELAAYDTVPAERRSGWIAGFWAKRDVAAGLKPGARLIEHYKRLEYALKAYPLSLPQTGRQKFHSALPSLDFQDEADADRLAQRYAECFPELSQLLGIAETIGHASPFDYYTPKQDLVDDRGAVWIRQGPPDKIATSIEGDAVEVWRYDRPNGPLYLQFRASDFQGAPGASTLVPTILTASPAIRNQVCGIMLSLCSGSVRVTPASTDTIDIDSYKPPACPTEPFQGRDAQLALLATGLEKEVRADGGRVGLSAVVRARDAGRAAIDSATRTDYDTRTFTHAVHPAVEIYGLARATDHQPELVVAFAVPGKELSWTQPPAAAGRVVYPVDILVSAARTSDGLRAGLDTLREFATAAPLTGDEFLTGSEAFPVAPGSYTASVTLTQSDGRGAVAALDHLAARATTSTLAASDLVLGPPDSHIFWNSGTMQVPLNPLNTFPAGGTAEVYVQLSGLTVGTSYQLRFEFYQDNAKPGAKPRLTVSTSEPAGANWVEIQRTLGLRNLNPGRYRLRLKVTGGGQSTASEARLDIVKQP